jgi:alpha-glucosidase
MTAMIQTTLSDRAAKLTWWRNAVIYQVYPRSFMDSDGDGIGDLQGIRRQVPYLRELGVDGIWLSPHYPSPQHDQGYDVADYTGVHPAYGTLDDFDALVKELHTANMRIIVDVVPNHCSVEHPLFVEALRSPRGSRARARFHFADGRGIDGELPPNNWRSMFGGPAWHRVADGQWYLHLFTPEQPDFNWRHSDLPGFFADVLRFWLDRGVDGFRIDAAQGLFKHPNLPDAEDPFEEERVADAANPLAWNRPEVHDVYRHWRSIADSYTVEDGIDRPLVGEITGIGAQSLPDYVAPDQLHQGFFFDFMRAPWHAPQMRATVDKGLILAEATGSTVTWVLGNHDTVRVATRYGGGTPGSGPGDLNLGHSRARAAALLMLALPGSAYVYQGEELGLPEVVDLPADRLRDPIYRTSNGARRGRDGCRVPLPWEGDTAPYGFSPGTAELWLPQPSYFAEYTAATQQAQPGSTWALYATALKLRSRHLAHLEGFRWIPSLDGVLAFARGHSFMCVVNTTGTQIPAPVSTPPSLMSGPGPAGTVPANATAWWISE